MIETDSEMLENFTDLIFKINKFKPLNKYHLIDDRSMLFVRTVNQLETDECRNTITYKASTIFSDLIRIHVIKHDNGRFEVVDDKNLAFFLPKLKDYYESIRTTN